MIIREVFLHNEVNFSMRVFLLDSTVSADMENRVHGQFYSHDNVPLVVSKVIYQQEVLHLEE